MPPTSSIRHRLDHVLGLLGLEGDPYAPRELAVAIVLRDGVSVETVLERLGLDLSGLKAADLDPTATAFAGLAVGTAFERDGTVWTKATLDAAVSSTKDRDRQRLVVRAYATATRQQGAPNAFAWEDDATSCVAVRFSASMRVIPRTP
ncbi:hypothetical protein [Rubrivirga sp.]|uniref:hypothetical protein n=1 Tax=Rubrivirga sp. TaxID=1885344 RepID=UPI003C77B755